MRRRQRCGSQQPGLGLRVMPDEKDLRKTYVEYFGERRPFEEAMKSPAIEVCVRNTAMARVNRQVKRA